MISGIKKIFSGINKNSCQPRNIILTGIPRSGTTLTCKILLEADDLIALNEPIEGQLFKKGKSPVRVVQKSFRQIRKNLLKNGVAPVRNKDGAIVDNAYSSDTNIRKRVLKRTNVAFNKPLNRNFTLILKHCAEFTLILPELTKEYECYAVIRNPLAVLASWDTVNVPVSRGKLAKSRILNPKLHKKLESLPSTVERQLYILNWYYSKYSTLPDDRVIRYEDIIQSNGACLSVIAKQRLFYDNLTSRNSNNLYNKKSIKTYFNLLQNSEGSYFKYYSIGSISALAKSMGV